MKEDKRILITYIFLVSKEVFLKVTLSLVTSIFITLYSFPRDQFSPLHHWKSEELATDCVLLQEIFTNVGSREPTRCPITYRPKSLSLVEAKVFDRWVVKFIAR